jgi:hypothetical protein
VEGRAKEPENKNIVTCSSIIFFRHGITEILFKVALNIINHINYILIAYHVFRFFCPAFHYIKTDKITQSMTLAGI